jgi:hypothetical protein
LINIYVIVEGQCEENFVNNILKPYFFSKNIFLKPEQVITGKDKHGTVCKGGGNSYGLYKKHIQNRIKNCTKQKNCYITTMIDFYGLPNDFPKSNDTSKKTTYDTIKLWEKTFFDDIGVDNFIPYIQLYEFETLLYCDIDKICDEFFDLDIKNLKVKITKDIQQFDNIELINNSIDTSPSKRLNKLTDGKYCNSKVASSTNILKKIDIKTMLQKCTHFKYWIEKLTILNTNKNIIEKS